MACFVRCFYKRFKNQSWTDQNYPKLQKKRKTKKRFDHWNQPFCTQKVTLWNRNRNVIIYKHFSWLSEQVIQNSLIHSYVYIQHTYVCRSCTCMFAFLYNTKFTSMFPFYMYKNVRISEMHAYINANPLHLFDVDPMMHSWMVVLTNMA